MALDFGKRSIIRKIQSFGHDTTLSLTLSNFIKFK
jgi:hypothetical protein